MEFELIFIVNGNCGEILLIFVGAVFDVEACLEAVDLGRIHGLLGSYVL